MLVFFLSIKKILLSKKQGASTFQIRQANRSIDST